MSVAAALRQLRGNRAQGAGRSLQLQMVSMIDVVFLLLVFFLLTANFRSREGFLPAELPRRITRAELAVIEPLELVIATLANGQCQVSVAGEGGFVFRSDSNGGGFAQLLEQLQQTLATQKRYAEDPIKLRPLTHTRWDHVVQTYDVIRQLDLQNVIFAVAN